MSVMTAWSLTFHNDVRNKQYRNGFRNFNDHRQFIGHCKNNPYHIFHNINYAIIVCADEPTASYDCIMLTRLLCLFDPQSTFRFTTFATKLFADFVFFGIVDQRNDHEDERKDQ